MKEILKNIILENQNSKLPESYQRNLEIPIDSGMVISIIGPRRSGKTFLLYNTIKQLIKKGIQKETIFFINFEDERLKLNSNNLDLILQAFLEIYPNTNLNDVHFFFDEIQNITGWEKFIRRLYDTKSRKIFITGSNAKLLSTEIATELRGRALAFTLFPLNFKEFLFFHNIEPNLNTQKSRSLIINYAQRFMYGGGFPETIHFDSNMRLRLHQEYFNVMIFRDIIERYKVTDPEMLKFFIKKAFASVTKPFSVNKTYNELKSMGYKISNKYLYDYLAYCNAVFLSLTVNKFHFSEIKQSKSDKKAYIIDNGLLSSVEFSVSKNSGKLFENMVALELIKAGKEIFYFKDNYECDFIVKDNNTLTPMQVCFFAEDNDTMEREFRGLYEACSYLKTKSGILLTYDKELEQTYKNIDVKTVPFYRYFLQA